MTLGSEGTLVRTPSVAGIVRLGSKSLQSDRSSSPWHFRIISETDGDAQFSILSRTGKHKWIISPR
jgi:hypothetical protein